MGIYIYCLLSIPLFWGGIRVLNLSLKRSRLLFFTIAGIQLFLIAALRGETVGTDLENYLPAFKTIVNTSWDAIFEIDWEPGYIVFNKLLSLFSDDNRFFLIVTSLFTTVGYLLFIWKNSKKPWLSVFLLVALGYYLESFNIIRQSMAMVIVLHGLIYAQKRCFIKYLLCILCAMLFHKTAIICLLPYFFFNIRPSIGNFGIMLVCGSVISSLSGTMLLSYVIQSSFSTYSLDNEASSGYSMLLFLSFLTVVSLLFSSKKKEYNLYNHMLILACFLQLFSLHFTLFARIVVYFSIILIVLVPNLVAEIKLIRYRVFAESCVVVLAMLYFYVIILSRNLSAVVPYLVG